MYKPILFLFLATTLQAQDLASIDRKIAREPVYKNTPDYGLLVLGPNHDAKLWMVRDGDVLYIDRHGKGDLTAADARVQADAKSSAPSELEFVFNIGKLPDCPGQPSEVQLTTRKLSALPELNEAMKQTVSKDANALMYTLYLQTTHDKWKGNGIGGRLVHIAGPLDHRGALAFGKSAAAAPVIHVGGPLQIVPYGDLPRVRAGNSCEIDLSVGTPGLGEGATAFLGYEKTVPPDVKPTLDLVYPKGEKQTAPFQVNTVLHERCCTINFYGKIQIPEDVGVGKAQLTIKMNDWKEGNVQPSESTLEIIARATKVIPQTVSLSPVKTFAHQDRSGFLYQLQFSPDVSRLYAASYPGGIIQLWDIATGLQLKSIDTGKGYRGSANYSMLSPDWKEVWVGEEKRGKHEAIEVDGKKHIKWTFDARLRGWNTETGVALDPIIPEGRNFRQTYLSPDGHYLIALEEVSGTFPRELGRQQKVSLYDMHARKKLPFSDKYAYFSEFTKDSKHIFVQETTGAPNHELIAWRLVSIPEGKIIHSLEADRQKDTFLLHHTADNKRAYLFVTKYQTPNSYQKYKQELQCWNMETGKKEHTIEMGDETTRKSWQVSDDHRWLVTSTQDGPRKPTDDPSVMELYSLPDLKQHAKVNLPGKAAYSGTAFHPHSDLLAQVCQSFPKEAYTNRDFDFHEDEMEQPKLVWIDLKKGTILRTDTLPPAFPGRLKFTPDGKTLAITVKGAVQFYDVPGELLK